MMISENLAFETQFKIFISWKSHVPILRYLVLYITNYSINFKSCEIMMNIRIWDRVNPLNHKLFGHKTRSIIDAVMVSFFYKRFCWFGGPSPTPSAFLIYHPIIVNQKLHTGLWLLLFWRYALRRSKVVNTTD